MAPARVKPRHKKDARARRGDLDRSHAMLLEGVSQLLATPTARPHELLEALITLEQQRSFAGRSMDFDPLREAGQVARQAFGADSLQADIFDKVFNNLKINVSLK